MSTQSQGGERKVTTLELREMKSRSERITVLTAYDHLFARLVDRAGTDVILVGDSMAQVVLGLDSTLPITLEDMIHHASAVCRGVKRALVVVDLPFLTYQVSREEAVRNAGRILKETGATAVKLEGGSPETAETVAAIVRAGIPVMGHLGLQPQSIHAFGGYKVQGRGDEAAQKILRQAVALEQLGAFSIVLECIPAPLASEVTAALRIPTIGIGAGAGCDGQAAPSRSSGGQAVNELPQPQPPVAFGFLNVNPDPCMDDT